MAQTFYERLPFLDSTFLALESPVTPMHVGATILFDAAPLRTGDGGIDIDRIRAFTAGAMQYVPRYRQRLEWIPLERHPVWVDDEHFSIDRHVRHTALPHPGTEAQLREFAGHVLGQRLDRGKPLWEVWVVEGLDGDRFAVVTKVHHCMIDGIAGVDLLKAMLSPIPDPEVGEPDDYRPRPAPSPANLAIDEAFRRTRGIVEASRSVARFVEESRELSDEVRHRLDAVVQSVRSGWFRNVPPTPINGSIGPNRRLAWMETDLKPVKHIKGAFGGTVNDVVIAVVAGALRRFLSEDRCFDVGGAEMRAMIPVSLRGPAGRGELGNELTMWLVDLPIEVPDPAARLMAVISRTTRLKGSEQALGAATLTQSMAWTPGTLLSAAARVAASTLRPFNLTITNVPGPQIPLYLLGARMLAGYPMVPLWASHGLGVALFSYDRRIAWGLAADDDLVPDVEAVAGRIREELDALVAAADAAAPNGETAEAPRPEVTTTP